MDLQKAKIKKREAENQILKILNKLAQETGCQITKLEYPAFSYTKGVWLKITLEV